MRTGLGRERSISSPTSSDRRGPCPWRIFDIAVIRPGCPAATAISEPRTVRCHPSRHWVIVNSRGRSAYEGHVLATVAPHGASTMSIASVSGSTLRPARGLTHKPYKTATDPTVIRTIGSSPDTPREPFAMVATRVDVWVDAITIRVSHGCHVPAHQNSALACLLTSAGVRRVLVSVP